MKILESSIAASRCTRYLAMAAADDLADKRPGWWLESAIEQLHVAAELLGYQLVKLPPAPSITTILPLNLDEESEYDSEQFPTAIPLAQIHGGLSIETTLALITATGDVISDFDLTLRIAYNWHGHWYVENARTADDVVIDENDAIMWAVIRRAVCREQTQNWISRKVENHMQEAE